MKLLRFSIALGCLLIGSTVTAQSLFMKVTDPGHILGESLDMQFQNWTEISAFNGGSTAEVQMLPGSGINADRPVTKCFTISMRQDRVAHWFKKEMYAGTLISNIQFDFTKMTSSSQPQTYYRVLLENVAVSAIEEAVNEDGMSVMNVSFVPAKFRYTYWPLTSTGTLGTAVIFGWDQQTNKAW